MTGSDRVPVLLAITGRPYEESLLAGLDRPGNRLQVARRCLDLTDLLAAAGTSAASVAVVWCGLHRFDRESLARLDGLGVRVVAVVEPLAADHDDGGARESRRLLDLGAAATVLAPGPHDDASTTRFLGELYAQVLAVAAPQGGPGHSRSTHQPTPLTAPCGPAVSASAGRLVVVWGPTGAPGRTTVAVGLAGELADLRIPTLLADADTYGPSVAQRLGILDEASGMAMAARAANSGHLDATTLGAAARSLSSGLRVLTGLTRADRWPELPAPALAHLWGVARTMAGVTVVDAGFCLEEDDELSFDAVSLRRNASTVTSLAAADAVVVVGSADPVGLARLVRGLHELDELGERRPGAVPGTRFVVVNRVRASAVGTRRPERRICELLDLDLGRGPGGRSSGVPASDRPAPVLVPDDPLAFDRAVAAGRTLAETAPRSVARGPVAALARELTRQLGLA